MKFIKIVSTPIGKLEISKIQYFIAILILDIEAYFSSNFRIALRLLFTP